MFHPRCGRYVTLTNGNKTACRFNPQQEFNKGLVFSLEPIKDNEVFEIKIDRKLNTWSGSIEIGVTVCNPDIIDIPLTATDLRGGTWVLLGHGVLRDGKSVQEAYGCDLDQLVEGDRVGVMRSGKGDLEFYINGESQGVAAMDLPPLLYAVVDMYGKCAQITLTHPENLTGSNNLDVDSPSEISASDPLHQQSSCNRTQQMEMENNLSERGNQMGNRENQITYSNNQITNRDNQISYRDNQIANTDNQISYRDNQISNTDNQISYRDNQISNTDNQISDRDNQISNRTDQLLDRDNQISNTDNQISNRADQLVNRDDQSNNSDNQMVNRDNQSNNSDNQMVNRDNQVNESDNQISNRDNQIIERDNQSGNRDNQLDSDNQIRIRDNQLDNRDNHLTEMDNQLSSQLAEGAEGLIYDIPELPSPFEFAVLHCDTNEEDSELDSVESSILTNHINNIGLANRIICATSSRDQQNPSDDAVNRSAASSTLPSNCADTANIRQTSDAVSSLREAIARLSDDDFESEDDENEEAASKGNGKGLANLIIRSRNATGSSMTRPNTARDSNIILSNTEHLCRLLNITMESIRTDASDSGSSARESSARECTLQTFSPSVNIESLDPEIDFEYSSSVSNYGATRRNSHRRSEGGSSPYRRSQQTTYNGQLFCNDTLNNIICNENTSTGSRVLRSEPNDMENAGGGSTNQATSNSQPNPSNHNQSSNQACGGSNPRGGREGRGDNQLFPRPPNDSANSSTRISSGSSKMRFHSKCGSLVRLSGGGKTAERSNPLDEFNNGVVMSHRELMVNELFEIRIDRLIDKWSGSIEVGITTHNPASLKFPATMTNLRSGTTMMSGIGILKNGKGMLRRYGNFNLDELKEGDRIGMLIRPGRSLHYSINGMDQGVASDSVPEPVWCVVDLYGMTVKVTIIDSDERDRVNLLTQQADEESLRVTSSETEGAPSCRVSHCLETERDSLSFHVLCGASAAVINNGLTAHRPNANDDFNHGVVLTSRPLRAGELLEVKLDNCVAKWAGSLEIGVTTHSPDKLDYPSTMTNVRTGTWMMTGNGVMHNGTTVIDEYGLNLDRLRVGDKVGVVRYSDGTLHFSVNGVDQGVAARRVPSGVYGVVDLYGQAAQATIIPHHQHLGGDTNEPNQQETAVAVEQTSTNVTTTEDVDSRREGPHGRSVPHNERQHNFVSRNQTITSVIRSAIASGTANNIITTTNTPTVYTDLKFHPKHGCNVTIIKESLGAKRPNAEAEFNDAIVMSSRQLHRGEMFEVVIEQVVQRWSGSLEAGVTAIHPDDIELPSTMTDIGYDTWMLSGSSVMMNGSTIKNNYSCDLDSLVTGTRIGMMRHSDASLHYYVNGVDQGVACTNLPEGLWAVIDLYGQCAQVSIVHNPIFIEHICTGAQNTEAVASVRRRNPIPQQQLIDTTEPVCKKDSLHKFSYYHGTEVCVGTELRNVAYRNISRNSKPFKNSPHYGLVFSESPLHYDELFEVKIKLIDLSYSGSIRIGLTTLPLGPNLSLNFVPPSLSVVHPVPHCKTWWIGDSEVYLNSNVDDNQTSSNDLINEAVSMHSKGKNLSVGKMDSSWSINVLKYNFCPHLSKLGVDDRIGVKPLRDGTMRLYINGQDLGVATSGLGLGRMHAVVELFGSCVAVETVSVAVSVPTPNSQPIGGPVGGTVCQDSLDLAAETHSGKKVTSDHLPDITGGSFNRLNANVPFQFSEKHGMNISLSSSKTSAVRTKGYDHGIVLCSKPLPRNILFQITLGATNSNYSGSFLLALVCGHFTTVSKIVNYSTLLNEHLTMPDTWIISDHGVYHNQRKLSSPFCPNFECLASGTNIGVLIDPEARLHLYINEIDVGVMAENVPNNPFIALDLYGKFSEMSILQSVEANYRSPAEHTIKKKSQHNSNQQQQQRNQSKNIPTVETTPVYNSHDEANLAISRSMQSNPDNSSTLDENYTPDNWRSPLQDNISIDSNVDNTNVHTCNNSKNSSNILSEAINNADLTRNQTSTEIMPSSFNNSDKIKISSRKITESVSKNCEYQKLCARFLSSLSLPDGYFKSDVTCYCEKCHKSRGEQISYTKSNGIEYHRPIGWCQFNLVSCVSEIADSWHMAYCAPKPGHIRRLLDKGELLFPRELNVAMPRFGRRTKDEDSGGSQLSFSPSINVSVDSAVNITTKLLERPSGKNFTGRMMLQVAVKPGAYKKVEADDARECTSADSESTGRLSTTLLKTLSNSERNPRSGIQWVTKERGATQLLALMISVHQAEK